MHNTKNIKHIGNSPLISIIIPNYNHGRYLERSVHSALTQTWDNIEVIVVDDGSTDGSLEILSQIAQKVNRSPNPLRKNICSDKDSENARVSQGASSMVCLTESPNAYSTDSPMAYSTGSSRAGSKASEATFMNTERLRIIHIPHSGLSGARNAGIKAAKGLWITLLDSDDYLEKNAVETLFKTASVTGADLVVAGHYIDRDDAQYSHRDNSQYTCRDYAQTASKKREVGKSTLNPCVIRDRKSIHRFFQEREGRSHTFAWGKLYSADLLKQINYPVGKLFEDIRVIPQLCNLTNGMAISGEALYHYCLHRDSITYSPDMANISEGLTARVNNLKYYSKNIPDITDSSRAAVAEYALFMMGRICREKFVSVCSLQAPPHTRDAQNLNVGSPANSPGISLAKLPGKSLGDSPEKKVDSANTQNKDYWNRAVSYLKRYRPILMRENPVYLIPCALSYISPKATGVLCMLYSMMKNGF